jgi:hypothetical protein
MWRSIVEVRVIRSETGTWGGKEGPISWHVVLVEVPEAGTGIRGSGGGKLLSRGWLQVILNLVLLLRSRCIMVGVWLEHENLPS